MDEPLVDPKVSHEAQDSNFQKQLQEQVRSGCLSTGDGCRLGKEGPPESQGMCIQFSNERGRMSCGEHVVSKT